MAYKEEGQWLRDRSACVTGNHQRCLCASKSITCTLQVATTCTRCLLAPRKPSCCGHGSFEEHKLQAFPKTKGWTPSPSSPSKSISNVQGGAGC